MEVKQRLQEFVLAKKQQREAAAAAAAAAAANGAIPGSGPGGGGQGTPSPPTSRIGPWYAQSFAVSCSTFPLTIIFCLPGTPLWANTITTFHFARQVRVYFLFLFFVIVKLGCKYILESVKLKL